MTTDSLMKEYQGAEEATPKVGEEEALYVSPGTGVADALWTMICNQSEEVQTDLAWRLNGMLSTRSLLKREEYRQYHSRDAIRARMDKLEEEMAKGTAVWMSEEEIETWVKNLD